MHVAHRDHARGEVALGGVDRLPAQGLRRPGRGHDPDLGRARKPGGGLGGARRDSHRDRGRGADPLEPVHHVGASVEGGRHLRSRDPHRVRIHEDERVGRIDEGGGDPPHAFDVEGVEHVAGGKERAGARAAGVEELEVHGRAGSRYARDRGVSLDRRAAVLHREPGADELAGVGVVDDDDPFRAGCLDEALVHREGSDGRGHVAAVAAPVDLGAVHRDLAEGVVHVRVGARRRPDDAHLGKRRDAPSHAVELPAVGVGASKGGDEESLPHRFVGRQIAVVEHHRVARAAAQERGGDSRLGHGAGSAWCPQVCHARRGSVVPRPGASRRPGGAGGARLALSAADRCPAGAFPRGPAAVRPAAMIAPSCIDSGGDDGEGARRPGGHRDRGRIRGFEHREGARGPRRGGAQGRAPGGRSGARPGCRSGLPRPGRRTLSPPQCQQAKRRPRPDDGFRPGEARAAARTGGPRGPGGACPGARGRGALARTPPPARGGLHHSVRPHRPAPRLERRRAHPGARRWLGLHHPRPGRAAGVAADPPLRAPRARPGRAPRGRRRARRLSERAGDRARRSPRRVGAGDRRLPPRPALHLLRVRGAHRPPERPFHLRTDGLLPVPRRRGVHHLPRTGPVAADGIAHRGTGMGGERDVRVPRRTGRARGRDPGPGLGLDAHANLRGGVPRAAGGPGRRGAGVRPRAARGAGAPPGAGLLRPGGPPRGGAYRAARASVPPPSPLVADLPARPRARRGGLRRRCSPTRVPARALPRAGKAGRAGPAGPATVPSAGSGCSTSPGYGPARTAP